MYVETCRTVGVVRAESASGSERSPEHCVQTYVGGCRAAMGPQLGASWQPLAGNGIAAAIHSMVRPPSVNI